MSKKQTIVLIIVAVIVLGVLVYLGVTQKPVTAPNGEAGEEVTEPISGAQVQGGSMVTEGGKVVTEEGEPVDNAAAPGSPTAPQQSDPISEEAIPRGAIKIQVSAAGFKPSEFTVNSGEVVTLSVTSVDEQTHIFKFNDPSLKAIAVGVGPGVVRALTFNAPDKRGEYQFFCDVPGHVSPGRDETGTMIVK